MQGRGVCCALCVICDHSENYDIQLRVKGNRQKQKLTAEQPKYRKAMATYTEHTGV